MALKMHNFRIYTWICGGETIAQSKWDWGTIFKSVWRRAGKYKEKKKYVNTLQSKGIKCKEKKKKNKRGKMYVKKE